MLRLRANGRAPKEQAVPPSRLSRVQWIVDADDRRVPARRLLCDRMNRWLRTVLGPSALLAPMGIPG
jgi:hypothetical protein